MLCALTVRQVKPGTAEQFLDAFRPDSDAPPAGWKRFHAIRGLQDENQVVTFGFFDGTLDELNASQQDHGYDERRAAAEKDFVEDVIVNGVFEVMMDMEAG
jgi:heme-degrading monooxygenase HmoA